MNPETKQLLTPQQVANRIGIKKRTLLERYAPRPDFPPRVAVSRQTFFWYDSDIDSWLAGKQETRPAWR